MSERINQITRQAKVINQITRQAKVWNTELRFTPSGKAVWNAGTSLSTQLEDEWFSVWFDVEAWEDLAEQIANDVKDGDEIVMRGREKAKAFRVRTGDVVTKPAIVVESYEVVARSERAPSTAPKPDVDTDDVPF